MPGAAEQGEGGEAEEGECDRCQQTMGKGAVGIAVFDPMAEGEADLTDEAGAGVDVGELRADGQIAGIEIPENLENHPEIH